MSGNFVCRRFGWTIGLFLVAALTVSAWTAIDIDPSTQCAYAETALDDCRRFITGYYDKLNDTRYCCDGVEFVRELAKTKEIRQNICKCYKPIAKYEEWIPDRVDELVKICGFGLPVPFRQDADCTKVE